MLALTSSPRGLILLAHGSRDVLWREPIEAVANRVREQSPALHVRCAYMELAQPDLAHAAKDLIAQGVQHIDVLPFFLGMGHHVREDLPRRVEELQAHCASVTVQLHAPVGQHEWLLDALTRIAIDASTPDIKTAPTNHS